MCAVGQMCDLPVDVVFSGSCHGVKGLGAFPTALHNIPIVLVCAGAHRWRFLLRPSCFSLGGAKAAFIMCVPVCPPTLNASVATIFLQE